MTEVRQLPGAIKSMGPISLFIRLKVVFINTSWRGIELIEEEIKSSAYSKVLIHFCNGLPANNNSERLNNFATVREICSPIYSEQTSYTDRFICRLSRIIGEHGVRRYFETLVSNTDIALSYLFSHINSYVLYNRKSGEESPG